MPEHIILQCFSCKMFQLKKFKNSSKWKCNLCNARQSIKKIFMKNEKAKECRVVVQEMNEKYIKQEEDIATAILLENGCCSSEDSETTDINVDSEINNLKSNDSKWNKFLELEQRAERNSE
nr:unnamed protein product [Callosobruchus chinensis]